VNLEFTVPFAVASDVSEKAFVVAGNKEGRDEE